ncbi:MAG TPA: NAD(P)-dependent oxidoreductase [Candidatus Eisenbacteria bacterium]|nr:NAD(P)-dependent oxidoreductase [Candidatus Eisenbacteria bacterium]
MRVGLVGTGIMGAPMARNLLRAGHTVTVHNRSPARVAPLVEAGATVAASPREVAARADAVVTCVPDTPDVEAVVAGPNGILDAAQPGLLVVDMSTIAPGAARALAERTAALQVDFLDAPVSGGEQGAINGTLSIMVGGRRDAFDRAAPIFAAIGKTATYMGASGQGQMTKLVNQVVGAATLAAVAEGIQLGARAGLDPAALIDAIGGGAASSWMWTNLGPRMQRRDFTPGFMVKLQQKDLRLAIAAAAEVGAPLPLTALVQRLLAAVEARGDGALGTQAIVTAIEALARG